MPDVGSMKSEETRHHLVRMVLHDNVPVARAAQSLGMSRRSASRFLKYYEETGGSVHYDPAMWNRHADNVMDDAAVKEAVLSAGEEHPGLFSDEMETAVAHVQRMVAGGLGVSVAPLLPYMDACDPEKAWVDQPDRCVLVLDNARVHDAVALSIDLREAGVFVLLLPPYSPEFNPIEDVF
eukprot:contig_15108_g3623